ncbi:hypothetical protein TWF696_003858 [Orbilia brochopaga]|uniref:Uncharacterized protein n=1 Tax=Orbilia brochopaga TaxID=3140254 RepID=A0AAV9V519_9PEZI
MGVKQLARSISKTIKKGTKGFKRVVLRRARAVPKQVSTIAHGHIPHGQKQPSKKVLTRAQRMAEYRAITDPILPTFGPRVPTPPPIIRDTGADLTAAPKKTVTILAKPQEVTIAQKGPVTNGAGSSANGTTASATGIADAVNGVAALSLNDAGPSTAVNGTKPRQRQKYSSLIDACEPLPPRKKAEKAPAVQNGNNGGPSNGGPSNVFVEKAFKGW